MGQEISSSVELLPAFGDDSVSQLEYGGRANNEISAFSDSFSQEITELSKSYESSNYELTNGYFFEETRDNLVAKRNEQITSTTATERDPLTGNIDRQAARSEPIYGFSSTTVTVDSTTGTDPTRTMTLRYIETIASNIELQQNDGTVPSSDAPAAINGGFFAPPDTLASIAVNNDIPVSGNPGEQGSGWFNDRTSRGTLYWDGDMNTAGIEVVSNAGQLTNISDRSNYWAQGGISMELNAPTVISSFTNADEGLPRQTYDEDLRGINGTDTGKTQRSALIYDDISNNGTGETGTDIYLVTTQDAVTLGEFRAAIQETPAFATAEDGIFLDGGGSTQLKTPTFSFSGDGRTIPQIVALKSTTNPSV